MADKAFDEITHVRADLGAVQKNTLEAALLQKI